MSRRPSRLYRDQLLRLGNGYPLYEPDPGSEEPVQVGDVGYINTKTGHFHRAFNVLHEKSAPINQKRGVPDLFEPLPPNLRETLILGALPPGVHTSSLDFSSGMNLGIDSPSIPAGARIQLSCQAQQGAALIIKREADRIESVNEKKLGESLLQNYRPWLAFLREHFGSDIPLREMVIVTGCDLTTDWATAILSNRSVSGNISFTVSDAQTVSATPAVWGKWECSTSMPVRCGPSSTQKGRHLPNSPASNQCIFVRCYRVNTFILTRLRAAAGSHDNLSPSDDNVDHMGSLLSTTYLSDPEGLASDIESVVSIHDESWSINDELHPIPDIYEEIFDQLFKNYDGDVALLHDYDVANVFQIGSNSISETTQNNSYNQLSSQISFDGLSIGTEATESDAKVIQFLSTEFKLPEDYKYSHLESSSNTYVGTSLSGISGSNSETCYESDTNIDEISKEVDKPRTIPEKRVKFASSLKTVLEMTDEEPFIDEETDEDHRYASMPSLPSLSRHVDEVSLEEVSKKALHPYLEFTRLAWDVSLPFSSAAVRNDRKGTKKSPLLPSEALASATHPKSTHLEIQFPSIPWKPLIISRDDGITMRDIGDEVYKYLQMRVQVEEYRSFPHAVKQSTALAFYARCDRAEVMGGNTSKESVRMSGLRRVDILGGVTEFISLLPVAADVYQLHTILPRD